MSGLSRHSGMSMRLLALALGGLAGPMLNLPVTEHVAPRRQRREIPTSSYSGYYFGYRRGPGWTSAQVKRMAKKRRNQIRNRRAHKKARTA